MGEDELCGVAACNCDGSLRRLTWSKLAGMFFKCGPGDDILAASIAALQSGAAGVGAIRCFRRPNGLCDRPGSIAAQAIQRDYRVIGRHVGSGKGSGSALIVREVSWSGLAGSFRV